MHKYLNLNSLEDYRLFLQIKSLPRYSFTGRMAWFPDEYAGQLGIKVRKARTSAYTPAEYLYDYQRDISALAIRKQKFAAFWQCGLGKTGLLFEFARHVAALEKRKSVLVVSPLMVIEQTLEERERFYGDSLKIEQVSAADLPAWLAKGRGIGITNYEAIRDGLDQGNLAGVILDESSSLKSAYGKWGTRLIQLGKGLDWKLCLTGTPAPNDRIEYANHAVFLDAFPTVNSFLARFFVNKGQTGERWELKQHALGAFYRALSHWCIFLENPATYGWKDNVANIPPIHVHIEPVELTAEQRQMVFEKTGLLHVGSENLGGITKRSTLSQIAKGHYKGRQIETGKPDFIRGLVDSWPTESTIIWCIYNEEQAALERTFPDAASIQGTTKYEKRRELIADFKAGRRKTLISKADVLGFGLNLQVCTRMIFSGLEDSYEGFWQCVKRANRIGSTCPLNVHLPVTEVEMPMVENVLAKAKRVQGDAEEQERIFKEFGYEMGLVR